MYLPKFNILVLLIMISCQNNKYNEVNVKETKEDKNNIVVPERIFFKLPENANVLADFEKAIKNSDYRFVGVMKYSLVVPDISNYHGKYDKRNIGFAFL